MHENESAFPRNFFVRSFSIVWARGTFFAGGDLSMNEATFFVCVYYINLRTPSDIYAFISALHRPRQGVLVLRFSVIQAVSLAREHGMSVAR